MIGVNLSNKTALLSLVFVGFLLSLTRSSDHSYDGYKLLSVHGKSVQDLKILQGLERYHMGVDFWSGPALDGTSTLLLPPHLVSVVESSLNVHGIGWKELDVDVLGIIEAGMKRTEPGSSSPRKKRSNPFPDPGKANTEADDIIDHTNYHTYHQIEAYLNDLAGEYPDLVDIDYLPYATHEGRKVVMAKLHGYPNPNLINKASVVMESGIHAREWISPAATLYGIEKLLQRYVKGDIKARFMLESFDWYIVPVTNPDGYDYTHTSVDTRLWRKNRRMINFDCAGVDLNRNFDVFFGTTGISSDCWSLIYPGVNAFSEPETANIRELFHSLNESVIAYLSVHSYSQLILVPWSFSNVGLAPENIDELNAVANKMAEAIELTHGKIYEVGSAYDLLNYAASGSSKDWAIYDKPGIFAVTYELRPDSEDPRGFNLPPDEIIPTGQEFLASLQSFALNL